MAILAILVAGIFVFVVLTALVSLRRTRNTTEAAADQDVERIQTPQSPDSARSSRPSRRERSAVSLPADATVTFADERRSAGIDEVLDALDADLVGLVPVKKKVQEVAALLLVDRARNKFGLEAPRPNLHMCFTGPPGTVNASMQGWRGARDSGLVTAHGYSRDPRRRHLRLRGPDSARELEEDPEHDRGCC